MIYVFDRNEVLLEIISDEDYSEFDFKDKLQESSIFSFNTSRKNSIKKGNKVGFFRKEKFQLFLIDDFTEITYIDESQISVVTISDYNILGNSIIEDKRVINGTLREAAEKALEGSDYKVGIVESFENKNINFYFVSRLKALNDIVNTFNCEIDVRIEIDDSTGKITNKYIDFKHRLGKDTGLRFTFDTNLEVIEKSPIGDHFNVLYGRGKSLETDSGGYSRKLDFAEVNNGKKYVADLESIKKYGRLEGIYEDDNIENKQTLLSKTLEKLEETKNPKFTYKISLKNLMAFDEFEHYQCEKGDTVLIIDEEEDLVLESRVVEIAEDEDEIILTLSNIQTGLMDEDLESELGEIKDKIDNIENNQPTIDNIYPNTLPDVPILTSKALYSSVILEWTYSNKEYYTYELFASQIKDFNPTSDNRIFEGKASSYLHEVNPSQTWYYRVRAKNSYGKTTLFSTQVEGVTFKISDATEFFEELAIGHALIKDLDLDKATVGKLKGQYINAKNLSVTDGNGKRTLDIDSYGNVYLDVKTLKINSKDVATSTQLQQLNDNFNFKVSNTGSENLILNSNFDAEFKKWELHGRPTLSTHNPHLSPRYGKMVTIQSTSGGEGIYQRFPTIPGQKYTVSFYAESDELRPLNTTIGIEDVHLITLVYEPGFKRWHFTFEATEKQHTFIAYLGESGKFYIGRVMVNQGEQLQEYRKYTSEIYSTNVKFDIDGMEIDSTNAGTKNRIDAEGMKILNKSDNSVLLEIIQNMIRAKGGAFIVDHKEQGYTKLWGRDIEINGQRALVGTNSKTQSPLKPNKLYVNYNNDFINGVEIAGELTNNTKKIISVHDSSLNENGFVFLSNGLKLQWGKVTINIQNGKVIEGTVNFPTPFPGACIIFQANLESVDNNNYWSANYNIVSKPFNRFAGGIYGLNLQKYIEQQGAVAQLSWFAIGV